MRIVDIVINSRTCVQSAHFQIDEQENDYDPYGSVSNNSDIIQQGMLSNEMLIAQIEHLQSVIPFLQVRINSIISVNDFTFQKCKYSFTVTNKEKDCTTHNFFKSKEMLIKKYR